jgi:hypothetical protein
MDYSNKENYKKPVTNNHLKYLFGLDNDVQNHYFEEIQRKYWEKLKPANDNNSNKRGENA